MLLKRIQTTLLTVLTLTRKTTAVLVGGIMAGAAASASVQTFPCHTLDWTSADPPRQRGRQKCMVCQNWLSSGTNAQGWKIHLSKQHHITATSLQGQLSQKRPTGRQATMLSIPLPQHVVHKYENAVIDYIIGGDISLRAASEEQFYKLVETLTNGCCKPPSTRTILRRTVELFNIAQPLLAKFLCSLAIALLLQWMGSLLASKKGFMSWQHTWLTQHQVPWKAYCFQLLLCVDPSLSAADMKAKLKAYEKKLVQLPAIVAGYLNPQIHKPTDPTKLKELKTTIRAVYVVPPHNVLEQSNATRFLTLLCQ